MHTGGEDDVFVRPGGDDLAHFARGAVIGPAVEDVDDVYAEPVPHLGPPRADRVVYRLSVQVLHGAFIGKPDMAAREKADVGPVEVHTKSLLRGYAAS